MCLRGGNPGRELLRIRWRGWFVCRVRQRFAIVDMARSSRVGIVVPPKTGLLCWSGMWYSNRFVGLVACIL
jgi:hypothetical protein